MDEPELIRLRAMVALWIAELHEACHFGDVYEFQLASEDANQSRDGTFDSDSHVQLALESRKHAQDLLQKLSIMPNRDE
jgi:hypothetical protein